MKTRIAATIAAALALTTAPAMAAPSGNHGAKVSQVAKSNSHKFSKGEKFDRSKATNYRVVSYRENNRLKSPPSGYHWVRNGSDALLVGITSGVVASVVSSVF